MSVHGGCCVRSTPPDNGPVTTRINVILSQCRKYTLHKVANSNLRQDHPRNRERVPLVTRGHFRSRDKDGGHTIRFAVPENLMLHAKITSQCFN